MSEQSNSPSPSNNGNTVQKKKSFRNRNRKSSNNLKAKPSDQLENGKKVNSDKIPKKQVNKENNDNKKPEIEKKEVDKKKNRYHKKKSVSDIKRDDSKSDTVSDARSDITSSTNEKQDLKKSASKQFLNQKKKRKSKINLKAEKKEEEEKEDNTMKDVISFMNLLSMRRDEMEREEEELINNPPPPQPHNTKPTKKPYNKTNKPKKELPHFNEDEIRRVLDCYDFPVAFRTPNLIEIFKEYEGSFSWIWIHDSRILFIFDTEENAKSAYLAKRNGTNYKLKPYENPVVEFSPYNDPKINAIKILQNIL